jgi:hypothetical protein
MDTKSHRINLTQKRKAENGQWHFYPVQWDGNKPDPRLIIIDEEPAWWKGEGRTFSTGERAARNENANRLAGAAGGVRRMAKSHRSGEWFNSR